MGTIISAFQETFLRGTYKVASAAGEIIHSWENINNVVQMESSLTITLFKCTPFSSIGRHPPLTVMITTLEGVSFVYSNVLG